MTLPNYKIWSLKTFLSVVVFLLLTETVTAGSPYFPPEFSQLCRVENENNISNSLIMIKCDIKRGDNETWRLDTLRNWIMTSTNNQSDRYSYELICDQSGGVVSVPFPMKCPRLYGLTVRNCNVTDIFADFGNPLINTTPPTLRKLEIIDSVMVQRWSTIHSMFANLDKLTSNYECLHDKTIERLIFRNLLYYIEDDMEDTLMKCAQRLMENPPPIPGSNALPPELPPIPSNVSEDSSSGAIDICDALNSGSIIDVPKRIKNLDISCKYEQLRYLEDSMSSAMSHYQFRFLAKYNKFPVLRFYNFSHNNIDEVPEELLDWSFYFDVIQYIDLSHNRISTLAFKSRFVEKLINDTYINLQYNNITTLRPVDLQHLKNQQKSFIDIRNNPIICDCELRAFVDSISTPGVFTGELSKYEYIRSMQCHTPEELKGRTLKSLSVEELDCGMHSWVTPFVALALISVLLLTIIVLAFIYRREIRILFYTRLNIQMPGVVYVGLGPKTYHAFVSYSNEDEDWVIDVLCKQLEEPNSSQFDSKSSSTRGRKSKSKSINQFKLCLHARDFVPGMTIVENIINSVENSRHTLIVLTENFVQSKWAMEEFYQAYQQSVLERRRHLIIIIRGDLPSKMNPILKRCLKTFTYLKTSDKLFFDRLAYSLSTENRMTKEESSREEEILKSRTTTITVDIDQDNDSGIFNTSDESLSSIAGQLNTQTSVMSTTNSEIGLVEATRL